MYSLSNKNVLVTGACGLIGSAVVEMLLKHYPDCNVYVMARNKQKCEKRYKNYEGNNHLHYIIGDVNEPLKSTDIYHYIINAASNANPKSYSQDPVGTFWTNINGTKHLLDYGKTHGMERFLYVSSGEIYGEGGKIWEESESGYINPMTVRSCYPTSKRATETLCVAYALQYGLDIVVARPCHTYGEHFTEKDNRVFAQFIRNAVAGENIVMKSLGEQCRSWLYVEDCATAIITILLEGISGEAYNVADEQSCITIRELAETIADTAGVNVIFDVPSEVEKKGFTPIRTAIFDTTKIRALGWCPQHTLKEAIRKTIEQQKNNK